MIQLADTKVKYIYFYQSGNDTTNANYTIWIVSFRSADHWLDFFDDLHLQIIEGISPKASVENSLAQWAIFFIDSQNMLSLLIL